VWNNAEARITTGAKRLGETFLSLQGIFAAFAGFQGLKMVMKAGAEAEESVNRLSSALKAAGVYSADMVKQMTAYSTARMNATTFDDEAVTSLQALLVTMTGLTGTAVEPLVNASLDLASALGMDAVSAGKMIAQSVNGRNILARYGIEVDRNASKQENLAKVVDQLAKKFGGFAENEALTATGRLKQMSNQIDETKEKIGLMANDVGAKLSPGILVFVNALGNAIILSVSAVQVATSSTLRAYYGMLAEIEKATNWLGITNSQTMKKNFEIANTQAVQYLNTYHREVNRIFGLTKKVAEDAKGATGKIIGDGDEEKMNKYAQRVAQLKEELQALVPASAGWITKMKEMTRLEDLLANLTEEGMMAVTGDVRISLWSKLFWGTTAQEAMSATQSQIASFFSGMKGPGTKLGVIRDYSEDTGAMYDAYKNVVDEISAMRKTNARQNADDEVAIVQEWLQKVKDMSLTMWVDVDAAEKVATERIAEIRARAFEKSFDAYAAQAQKGIGLVMSATSQKYEAELDNIQTAKEAELGRIDAALQNDKLSADQRKKLEAEKAAVTKKYDDEARAVKKQQWEADKEGRLFMAIIDTAAAVVKALPNLPLALIAGAMGAAQVAIIASQAAPKFKTGTGPGGFTVPQGFNNDNFPVLVSSGEKVRVTPRGGGGGDGATLNFYFNAPVSDEEFVYQSIVKRLRATGMPIDRTFRSSNTMALGNR
jgi:hypothetical protein